MCRPSVRAVFSTFSSRARLEIHLRPGAFVQWSSAQGLNRVGNVDGILDRIVVTATAYLLQCESLFTEFLNLFGCVAWRIGSHG
jgi:hypothetical protein